MKKETEIRCKKCKEEMDGFDYNYNGGICDSCKTRRGFVLGITLLLIVFALSVPLTIIQFNYEIDKCKSLRTTESNYDFTNTIEINAQFNKNCFFLNNHPFAFPSYFLMGATISIFFGMIGFMVGQMTRPIGFKRIDYGLGALY